MSRTKSIFAFFCLLICFAFVFTACSQKDNRSVVFETEFKSGNEGTFGSYGTIIEKENQTLILEKSENNIGPITYFGKTESKNSVWVDRGLAAELTFYLDPNEIETNECFDWTFVLNNKDFNPLSEVTVSFRKYEKGLRVGHSLKTGEEANKSATSEENQSSKKVEKSGYYVLEVSFYTNIKNEILYNVILKEKDKDEVLSSSGNQVKNSDGEKIDVKSVGGLRSAGLSYMTISSLTITRVRLLEN